MNQIHYVYIVLLAIISLVLFGMYQDNKTHYQNEQAYYASETALTNLLMLEYAQ